MKNRKSLDEIFGKEPQRPRKSLDEIFDKKPKVSTMQESIEEPQKPISDIEDLRQMRKRQTTALGRGILQGKTFGLGEETIAGAKALGIRGAQALEKKLYGDVLSEEQTLKDIYKRERGIEREKLRAGQKEFPITSIAGSVYGAVTSPLQKIEAGIINKIPGWKGKAIGGAVEGAISGFGLSEEPEKLKRDVGFAAAVSSSLNVILPVAGTVIKGIGKTLLPVKRMPKTEATKIISKYIDLDKVPEIKTSLEQAQKEGRETLLADVGGGKIQGLMRTVGKTKAGRNLIENALEKRSAESSSRVIKSLGKNISKTDNYFGTLEDLTEQRKLLAAPWYEKAFKKKLPILPKGEIKTIIEDDLVKKAYKEAIDTRVISKDVPINSIEGLNAVKRRLDGKIGRAIRAGDNVEVASLTGFKNKILKKLDSVSKSYKKAREISGDFFQMEDAIKSGRKDFAKITPEKLSMDFKKLTDAQKDAYRIGVRENLENLAANTAEGRNAALKIYNKPSMQKKLKVVIPSDIQRKKFVKDMLDEFDFMKTKMKVLGGSRTDINLADNEEYIITAANAVRRGGLKAIPVTVADSIFQAMKKRYIGLTDDNAKALTNILLNKEASIEALEDIIKGQKGIQKELVREASVGLAPAMIITDALIKNEEEK